MMTSPTWFRASPVNSPILAAKKLRVGFGLDGDFEYFAAVGADSCSGSRVAQYRCGGGVGLLN